MCLVSPTLSHNTNALTEGKRRSCTLTNVLLTRDERLSSPRKGTMVQERLLRNTMPFRIEAAHKEIGQESAQNQGSTMTAKNFPDEPSASEIRLTIKIGNRLISFSSPYSPTTSHLTSPFLPLQPQHPPPSTLQNCLPSKNGLRTIQTIQRTLPNVRTPLPTLQQTQRIPRQRDATA